MEFERILHIMWNMDIGGAERAVYQLIREQRRKGINSNVMILNKLGFYGGLCKETGAGIYFLKMKRAYDKSIKQNFLNIIKDFDIVHFHSAEPYPIYLSTLNRNIKKYYTHRGGVYPYSLLKSLRYRYCGHFFRKYFSGISGNTNEGARAASLLFNIPLDNVFVTYNGLDYSLLEPAVNRKDILKELDLDSNPIVIGTSANLKKWKRIDYLVKCAPILKHCNVKFLIIGDGPEINNLEKLTDELKVRDKIIFAGKKKHIADYLQVMDIFVLPSESLESFGNSAVEAMASGIPTIVMKDGGGLVEHIISEETGFIADDFNDLVLKLELLIGDKVLRTNLGKAAKDYIRNKYSLENMILNYNKLYKIN
jgi:glycosyltransferase involved in cell wall biosynthesis